MSRLRKAWIALGLLVVGLMIAAVLAPPPRQADTGTRIALPAEPDPYAAGPTRGSGSEAADGSALPETAPPGPALPEIVFADPGAASEPEEGGEVIITLSGGADAPPVVRPRAPAVPPAAPDGALTAETPSGVRPAIGLDGRTPFTTYRRLQAVGDAKGVAVIVSGLGLDPALTERAISLPASVSLGFAPYAKDLPGLIARARAAGHEVLIELPMGTPGVAPAALGPAGLLRERTPAANAKRLEWLLTRAPAYPMVTNYLGAGFSGDEAAMAPVMRDVSRLGVAYVDDTGAARGAARFAGVPYAAIDMLIEPDTDDVAARLRALAERAAPGEVALAKVYAAPASVAAVAEWAAALPADALLVPASAAVRAE